MALSSVGHRSGQYPRKPHDVLDIYQNAIRSRGSLEVPAFLAAVELGMIIAQWNRLSPQPSTTWTPDNAFCR